MAVEDVSTTGIAPPRSRACSTRNPFHTSASFVEHGRLSTLDPRPPSKRGGWWRRRVVGRGGGYASRSALNDRERRGRGRGGADGGMRRKRERPARFAAGVEVHGRLLARGDGVGRAADRAVAERGRDGAGAAGVAVRTGQGGA